MNIKYTVTEGGISPKVAQNCGVQGDHNVCTVDFVLDDALRSLLGGEPIAIIEGTDGHGAFYASEQLTVTGNGEQMSYIFFIPQELTAAGGTAHVSLVLCDSSGGDTVSYSYPMLWRFKSSAHGSNGYGVVKKSLVGIAAEVALSAERAATSEQAANMTAAAIQEQVEGAVAATEASAQAAAESAAAAQDSLEQLLETSAKDWAENDETSSAYIQNRTHYVGNRLAITIIADETHEGAGNFPELTDEQRQALTDALQKSGTTAVNGDAGHVLYDDVTVEVGEKTYLVGGVYNESDIYTHDVMVFETIDAISTPSPSMYIGMKKSDGSYNITLDTWGSGVVGAEVVFVGVESVVPLDEKFLPDTVAKREIVAQLDARIAAAEQALDGVAALLGGI